MPRQVRIEFAGAMYHVMARGDHREAIVRDDKDRKTFLRTLGEACGRTGFRIHAYVLMGNHYHLLVETPQANLAKGMGWLQNAYTRRINTRHRLWGHLFGDRYKSILVEPGNCFWAMMDYIHLNPVRAGMIKEADGVENYSWSSLKAYLSSPRSRPTWQETSLGMSYCECSDTVQGRREYLRLLESRVDWKNPTQSGVVFTEGKGMPTLAVHSALRRGWFFGSQEFREKLLKFTSKKLGERSEKKSDGYTGLELRDYGEKRAREIIEAGLGFYQITLEELRVGAKSDERKCLIAAIIHAETTVRLDWICEELGMGTRSWCCQQIRKIRIRAERDRELRKAEDAIRNDIIND